MGIYNYVTYKGRLFNFMKFEVNYMNYVKNYNQLFYFFFNK